MQLFLFVQKEQVLRREILITYIANSGNVGGVKLHCNKNTKKVEVNGYEENYQWETLQH